MGAWLLMEEEEVVNRGPCIDGGFQDEGEEEEEEGG